MDEKARGTQDFTAAEDPFALFKQWLAEAEKTEPADPEAMALATVDAEGMPNVRMILLKGADARGFVFYTNCESAKGLELAANPKAALLFYWKSLGRQIRIRGGRRPLHEELRRGRRAAPGLLAWLSRAARRDRVLATRHFSPARPDRIPPAEARGRLDQDPPLSVRGMRS
jgi:pyridoxine/pyridoxamine 5'-phosphate oxidase